MRLLCWVILMVHLFVFISAVDLSLLHFLPPFLLALMGAGLDNHSTLPSLPPSPPSDYDGSIPDINNNKPTSRVLDIIKGNDLYSAASLVPQSERWTDWWDQNGNCKVDAPQVRLVLPPSLPPSLLLLYAHPPAPPSLHPSLQELDMIDHILLTQGLIDKVVAVYMYHRYDEFCGTLDSDHYPVVVDLEWGEGGREGGREATSSFSPKD